jgi:hypothetical protein
MTVDMKRCDNLSCLCEVPLAEEACSDYCRSDAGRDATEILCECGHSACAKAVDAQLHGAAGVESV